MDLRKLKTLIDLVQQSGIAELEITEGEEKVRISRFGAAGAQTVAPQSVVVPLPVAAAAAEPTAPAAEAEAAAEPEAHALKSPMVGTFYRAPEPGARPFVEAGAAVAPDTTVCIIEVMKLMNSIPAQCRGTVAEILVGDGEAVEYGQPLIVITPV